MKYRHKLLSLILDFLFPRPAPIISIQNMSADEIDRKIPRAREIDGDDLNALFDYRDELAKQAIWEIKYRKNEKILDAFCKIFYEYMLDELADKALFSDFKNPILVPIPSSKSRLKERGYNQCELIAEELARIDGGKNFTLSKNILEKTKDSPSQTSVKNRMERLKNLKGCFAAANSDEIIGANIILIDDVITTGATMSEVKKTLLDAGARQVLCFALAH
ncbi:MAG: Phosphoribosyltransferase [Parcubacteria group bacterium GW2011_GWA2_42_18]|nr:MAG: Phosphoribosyltransferase [Parcubacteria group bacterium GW2011_GWA2_42_18]